MLNRRELLLSLTAAPLLAAGNYPVHHPRIEPLWRSPDGHANALEATPEGVWVGEQVTDIAYLLDWKTGRVLHRVPTESSNTSGIAYGGGFLWLAANGPATFRDPRPTDATSGEVVKVDAETGRTLARYPVPGGGGVHGLTWAENSLWITTLRLKSLTQVDIDFNILHSIPVTLSRAHGLAWDNGAIWCVFSNDYVIQKLDARTGEILEALQLSRSDPEIHGMTRHEGVFYYSDAGIAPGRKLSGSQYSGYVIRLHL